MKKILAIAIASAFAAPAFAATSNVDVYGIVNVSVNSIDDNDDLNGSSNISVTSNASRLGVKGSEDLGGGLSAIWQIESSINADEASGNLGGRNTFVGLSSKEMGTVLLGRHDTPMKGIGRKVDNFGDTLADSRNLLGSMDDDDGKNTWDLRPNNVIAYVSPTFSGLTVTGAYVTDWQTGSNAIDDNEMNAYSLSAVYANGPLMVGGAYEKHNDYSFSEAMWRVVGSYAIGDLTLAGQFEKISSDDNAREHTGWGAFANYKIGAITLKANYLRAGDEKASFGSDGANQWTMGADYALSKRTTVYAFYVDVNNKEWGDYGLGTGGGTTDRTSLSNLKGDDVSAYGIGLKHSF